MRSTALVLPAVIAIVALAAGTSCGGPRARPWGSLVIRAGQPIPLGLAASAADLAGLGAQAEAAAQKSGSIDGHSLAFMPLPVGCSGADPQAAVPDSDTIAAVAGVIGPMCSAACVYSESVLYRQRVTMLTPSCTAAAVVQQEFPIAFRLAWDNSDQAVLAAKYARTGLGARRAALVGDGSVYASSLLSTFKDVFRADGGTIVASSTLSSSGDMSALLRALQAANTDAVFIAIADPTLASVPGTLAAGLPHVTLFTTDDLLPSHACTEGAAAGFSLPAGANNLFIATGLARRDGSWRSELDLLTKDGCLDFGPELSDAVQLYARAITKVAKRGDDGSLTVPRQALRDAIARMQSSGVSGKTRFDAFGERIVDVGAALYRVDSGTAVVVKRLER